MEEELRKAVGRHMRRVREGEEERGGGEEERGGGRRRRGEDGGIRGDTGGGAEREVDAACSALKRFVKDGPPSAGPMAFGILLRHLRGANSKERYYALKLVDFVFSRSASFRKCLIENLDEVVSLATGLKAENPLPPPVRFAKLLKKDFKSMLITWARDHGSKYKSLNLGLSYVTRSTCSESARDDVSHEETMSRLDKVQQRESLTAARKTLQKSSRLLGSMRRCVLSFRKLVEDSLNFPVFSMLEGEAAEVGAEGNREGKVCNPERTFSFEDVVEEETELADEENAEQFVKDFGLPAASYSIDVTVGGSSETMRERMTNDDRARCQKELFTISKQLKQLSEWEGQLHGAVAKRSLSEEQLQAYQDIQKLKSLCEETMTRCQQVGLSHDGPAQDVSDSECEMEEVNIFSHSPVSPASQNLSDQAADAQEAEQSSVDHYEKRRKIVVSEV